MKCEDEYSTGYEYGKSFAINDIISTINDLEDSEFKKELIEYLRKEYKEYIRAFGKTSPTEYEKKFCYRSTYHYRGYDIDVFDDDYGQQYYFYFNNCCHGCGAYNIEYEECIRSVVDYYLDFIHMFREDDKRFFGIELRYLDHEHTKMGLVFRGEEIHVFDTNKYSEKEAIEKSIVLLNKVFDSEEFQQMEKERVGRGELYLAELMEKEEHE